MNLEKTTISLFDLFGYILPGFLTLITVILLISTLFDDSLMTISALSSNWVFTTIIAYFFGQICHSIGSWVKDKKPNWFKSKNDKRLSDPLYYHVRNSLVKSCKLELEEKQKIDSLETYILAESYVVANGKTNERDSLLAREGFHKTSMIAFAILTLVLSITLFFGGAKINISPNNISYANIWQTSTLVLLSLLSTLIFRRRFIFFNQLKITNILLLALSILSDREEAN